MKCSTCGKEYEVSRSDRDCQPCDTFWREYRRRQMQQAEELENYHEYLSAEYEKYKKYYHYTVLIKSYRFPGL